MLDLTESMSSRRKRFGKLSWIYYEFLFACILQFIPLTQGAGVLEVRLILFINDLSKDVYGQCCNKIPTTPTNLTAQFPRASQNEMCSDSCTPFFRVCLKQWENPIQPDAPCYFGSRITKIFSNTSDPAGRLHLNFTLFGDYQHSMKFPFSFNWPGSLSIIVEALHTTRNFTTEKTSDLAELASKNEKQLLLRVAELRQLKVSHDWSVESHVNNHNRLDFKYRIVCDEFYYGHDCGQYCRPRDDQYGHYVCTANGHKQCMEGWTGSLCNRAICAPGCHPENGYCSVPGECQCYLGYQGELCEQCVRYPGCAHGTCKRSFECRCDEGWGGLFCNQDLNFCTHHKPCQHGATCTNTGSGHYTCKCKPGFTGSNCEHRLETCANFPCLNGGTCLENGFNYSCVCKSGYSGRHCQSNARTCDDHPCENDGTCLQTFDGGYQCICSVSFEGTNCDLEKDECSNRNPCQNGGTCSNQRLQSSTSQAPYECSCPTGFAGRHCEININDCSIHPCLNNGTCIDKIGSFQCRCAPGFMGAICQHNVDDCLKRPCANGGTCFDLINDYHCMCRPGFRGKDCSIDINECESNPCRNGASCVDHVDSYQCVCPNCFVGVNCQERNDDCASKMSHSYNSSSQTTLISTRPRKDMDSSNSTLLIGLLILAVCLLILFFLIVLFLRLRRGVRRGHAGLDGNGKQNNLVIRNQFGSKSNTKECKLQYPISNVQDPMQKSSESKWSNQSVNPNLAEPNYYNVIPNKMFDYPIVHSTGSAVSNSSSHCDSLSFTPDAMTKCALEPNRTMQRTNLGKILDSRMVGPSLVAVEDRKSSDFDNHNQILRLKPNLPKMATVIRHQSPVGFSTIQQQHSHSHRTQSMQRPISHL